MLLAATVLSIPFPGHEVHTNNSLSIDTRDIRRPLYLIAHKVLSTQGVDDALKDGANALEMDMTAWKDGWWCDHDGKRDPPSWHASTLDQFRYVADKRKAGGNIQFVWLDIKNPNWCEPDDPKWEVCSVKGLQQMARDILQPAGVRVLYGFMSSKGKAFPYIRDGLNDNEAINLDNSEKQIPSEVNEEGLLDVYAGHKVGSYGDDDLRYHFGNCHEEKPKDGWRYTCTQLRQAGHTGSWGKIFGWTVTPGQSDFVEDMFTSALVDGTIYGFSSDIYSSGAASAAKDVMNWINKHEKICKKADNDDPSPWYGKP
ncbi:MAG: hypothetical protein Q9227_000766 [Pyrenula ochraceoflavens]